MSKRQNPLSFSDDELNQIISYIKNRFGEEWFSKNQEHILVQLYNRRDFLATNELVTLGNSLKIMDSIDKNWVDGRIREIKSKNSNNLKGYCFEIIGLAMLAKGQNYKLIPCKGNNPGTDGKLLFNDGMCMELSMKNYAISRHHEIFLKNANELYEYFFESLKNIRLNKFLTVRILLNEYAGDSKIWNFLKTNLHNMIFKKDYNMPKEFEDKVLIAINKTALEDNMNSNFFNHNFLMISPYHRNEKKNLYDKLDDAILNLKKNINLENKKIIYGLFIRVDVNFSIDDCKDWIEDYFQEKEVLIEFVILYQPGTARSLEKNETRTTMNFKVVFNNKRETWILNHPSHMPNFIIQVGELVLDTPKMMAVNPEMNQQTELTESYIFQKGDMFYNAISKGENSWEGEVSSPAPGIKIHSVVKIDGKDTVITIIDANSEELKII